MAKEKRPVEELSYEAANQELEQVVGQLEAGEQSLEESLALFERGQALIKRCSELLDQAELKVQTLSGQMVMPDEAAE
jgi:exodeoxyribonuclease VII small subunit